MKLKILPCPLTTSAAGYWESGASWQKDADQAEVDKLEAQIKQLAAERDAAIKERDDLKSEEWRIVNIVDDLMDSMGLGIQNFPKSKWNAWEEISMKVAGNR